MTGLVRKDASSSQSGEIISGVYDKTTNSWTWGSQAALTAPNTGAATFHRAYVKMATDIVTGYQTSSFTIESNDYQDITDLNSYTFLNLVKRRVGAEISVGGIGVRNNAAGGLANSELSFWVRGTNGSGVKAGQISAGATLASWRINGTLATTSNFVGTVNAVSNFDGALLVNGTASVNAKAFIGLESAGGGGGGGAGFVFGRGSAFDTSVQVYTNISTNAVGGGLSSAGPFVSPGGTSWTTSSDERLKDIIGPIENALDSVDSLRTLIYTLKDDESKARRVGVIAQDVQAVLPEAVTQRPSDEMLGVSYTDLVPLCLAAIKELKAQNELLKQRIDALEGNS